MNGIEMMLKSMGINPQQIMDQVKTIQDNAASVAAVQNEILASNARIETMLHALLNPANPATLPPAQSGSELNMEHVL